MIHIENLCCGYGDRDVLHGVSAHMGPGEMVGILGPNGGGKTTLLLALAGVIPVRSGRVRIQDEVLRKISPKAVAERMASVPQKAETTFALQCFSVVLMGRYPYLSFFGGYTQSDREIARAAMRRTGILDLARRPLDAVSGGEFQRVLMARAFAQETNILLLDEPAASLDPAGVVRIFDLLKDKNKEGALVLCAVHDLNLAAVYCDMPDVPNRACAAPRLPAVARWSACSGKPPPARARPRWRHGRECR
ncbi:MAG: ABC transporter ATP-binding protein, partial [Thermodesulfobacteriota bacterium]|nr:ABC transporter ATP-binding protein [Thermodesulfobacteriota bacterium]